MGGDHVLYTSYYSSNTYHVVLSLILQNLSLEKIRFRHIIRVEIASAVYFSYTTLYVNTCLPIAMGQKPWQQRPPGVKATPFLITSLVSYE